MSDEPVVRKRKAGRPRKVAKQEPVTPDGVVTITPNTVISGEPWDLKFSPLVDVRIPPPAPTNYGDVWVRMFAAIMTTCSAASPAIIMGVAKNADFALEQYKARFS